MTDSTSSNDSIDFKKLFDLYQKVQVTAIHRYRDGGTCLIETNIGNFFKDVNLPEFKSIGNEIVMTPELRAVLINAAFVYASRFFDIKRGVS